MIFFYLNIFTFFLFLKDETGFVQDLWLPSQQFRFIKIEFVFLYYNALTIRWTFYW